MALPILHYALYALAFAEHNSAAMEEQQKWFVGRAESENYGLSLASDSEAYAGHLDKARKLAKLAVCSAIRTDNRENGATWYENGALWLVRTLWSREPRRVRKMPPASGHAPLTRIS